MTRIPNRDWMYATPAQESYLNRLWASLPWKYHPYIRSQRRLLKADASAEIDRLKRAHDQFKADEAARRTA